MAATGVKPVVAALAGRRIDASNSKVRRFPLDMVERVRADLERLLSMEGVELLVCSAACGADLIALSAAKKAHIRYRIVLPFSPDRFKETSVTDRPGDWGQIFDEVTSGAREGDVIVLDPQENADEAYEKATQEIVRQAVGAAAPGAALAIAVWEGKTRQATDATASFLRQAAAAGMKRRTIRTS